MKPLQRQWRTTMVVIVTGGLIFVIGFGIRSSFGLFLEPMTVAQDWPRETFGLAMALKNLFWGLGLPVAGMLADEWGSSRVIIGGAVACFAGVYGMATVPLTTGIVAQVFGTRYMGTLFGIACLSHQIGSFLGIWPGGKFHGSSVCYSSMWVAGIVLGLLAALLHLSINESPEVRLTRIVQET